MSIEIISQPRLGVPAFEIVLGGKVAIFDRVGDKKVDLVICESMPAFYSNWNYRKARKLAFDILALVVQNADGTRAAQLSLSRQIREYGYWLSNTGNEWRLRQIIELDNTRGEVLALGPSVPVTKGV